MSEGVLDTSGLDKADPIRAFEDACSGLQNLGYSKNQAYGLLGGVPRDLTDVAEIVKRALAGRAKAEKHAPPRSAFAKPAEFPSTTLSRGVRSGLGEDDEPSKEKPMAKEKLPDRQCLQCGSDFTPKRADSNFCSKKCTQNAWYANRKKSAKVAARRISPAPVAESPHADPPLVVWLRLRQQLTDFEDANPDIRKQAARALKDLA